MALASPEHASVHSTGLGLLASFQEHGQLRLSGHLGWADRAATSVAVRDAHRLDRAVRGKWVVRSQLLVIHFDVHLELLLMRLRQVGAKPGLLATAYPRQALLNVLAEGLLLLRQVGAGAAAVFDIIDLLLTGVDRFDLLARSLQLRPHLDHSLIDGIRRHIIRIIPHALRKHFTLFNIQILLLRDALSVILLQILLLR